MHPKGWCLARQRRHRLDIATLTFNLTLTLTLTFTLSIAVSLSGSAKHRLHSFVPYLLRRMDRLSIKCEMSNKRKARIQWSKHARGRTLSRRPLPRAELAQHRGRLLRLRRSGVPGEVAIEPACSNARVRLCTERAQGDWQIHRDTD